MKQFILATSMLAGTTIGVGLFGLPYVTSKIGYIPILFYFFFLTALILNIHLMYGEIVLRTKGTHRLPGYAKIYLGKKGKLLALITGIVGLLGANLAYIIVGGDFLAQLFQPIFGGSSFFYIFLFFAIGSLLVYLGSNTIAVSEVLSLGVFFVIMAAMVVKGAPFIQTENLNTVDLTYLFLPYGIVLFALGGMSVIPETRQILGKNANLLKKIIIAGTIIPAITYVVFVTLVVGVTGPSTSQNALDGIKQVIGPQVIIFGYLFGIITTFTSYLTLSLTLKQIFIYDVRLQEFISWAIATLTPAILYLAGVNNFIVVIGLIGAITAGIDGILVIMMTYSAKKNGSRKPEYSLRMHKVAYVAIIVLFLLGIFASTQFQI